MSALGEAVCLWYAYCQIKSIFVHGFTWGALSCMELLYIICSDMECTELHGIAWTSVGIACTEVGYTHAIWVSCTCTKTTE